MIHTYMTHSTPQATMHALDTRTLNKQRTEALTVLEALRRNRGGWSHHPVVRQWSGYEAALTVYVNAAIKEQILRKCRSIMEPLPILQKHLVSPWWYGDSQVHAHYQALLEDRSLSQTLWPRGKRFPHHFIVIDEDHTEL